MTAPTDSTAGCSACATCGQPWPENAETDLDIYEAEHTGGQETDRDWSQAQDWKGMDGATAWLLINRHADGWGDTRAMMEAWLAANAAEAVRLERERTEAIRHAGAMLSNCAFNLSFRNPGQFTARDIESLDESRKAWDAAIRARSEVIDDSQQER